MHRFWTTIVEPLLTILRPEVIVEVGAEAGGQYGQASFILSKAQFEVVLHRSGTTVRCRGMDT